MNDYFDKTDMAIAMPDWEACHSCKNLGDNGCILSEDINMSLYLGDWILCDDWEKK